MRAIAIIGIGAVASGIFLSLSMLPAWCQSPNERARCLSIADVDSRVDCLENLRGRAQTAPSPMRRISPQEDRELDCRNPRDIPLCREYERQQGIRNDRPQPPTGAYRNPDAASPEGNERAVQKPSFPALTDRVVDQANIIPAATRSAIEPKLGDLEAKSGIQLVVATVTSLEGQEIEPYANELFRTWKLGQKEKNNGVLLLVAPKEHRVRIEVGYGLEGTLTDAIAKKILDETIIPRFRANDFPGGISHGVDEIIKVIANRASPNAYPPLPSATQVGTIPINPLSMPKAADQPSQDAPVTDCDTYAASPVDPERKSGGIPFEKINPNLAIPACESAVRQYPNSSRLIYQLGRAYQKNNNFSAALVQYQKAADQGNANAQYNLGVMYANGQGVAKDDAQAASWYRKAAEQGSALAQNNLGSMYRYGLGVTQNNAEAVKWYRLSADQGAANAQFNLGVMYEIGQGVQQNYAEAVKWYRMAGDQGNANAQNNLGAMYASGQGVAKDYALAIAWFREAAEQGFASAQFILGIMYEDGVGITKDEAQAAAWYRKAAEQGDDDAKKKLAALQATKQCEQLAASTAYVVATCVVGGMEQSRKFEGLQSAKAQVEHAQAGLDCTPEALNNLQKKSNRSAAEILNSGAITTLMDFADAMNLECKKAAASILKSD